MDLRHTQQQKAAQTLALTMRMRASLDLLHKGQDEVVEELCREAQRNPFLRVSLPGAGAGAAAAERSALDLVAAPEDPIMAILHQIALLRLTPEERDLAERLPHCLDARGFLSDPAEEMCGYLDVRPPLLAQVVTRLQAAVEPAGVFAWSLADCFRIQLKAVDRADPLILRLLKRLDLAARRDIPGICRYCEVDEEDARDMLDDLRSLDPAPLVRPVAQAEFERRPELLFRIAADGEAEVELNPDALPTLLADDGLFTTMTTVETDRHALAYYRDCYRGAGAMVQAMQKRANTLLRIGQAMAKRQTKFLRTGRTQDRKSLTMGKLAQELGLNKSTISRALNNCFVETAHGALPASAFFVQPLNAAEPERTREQALRRLSVILRTEDSAKPFSDEALSEQLAHANIPVSRRVVAKYRAILGIPGQHERRRSGWARQRSG